MGARGVHGQSESRIVAAFLNEAARHTSALVVEGEPGIGKTTLWSTAIEEARKSGFRVLSARPGAAEVVLTFSALADLLSEVQAEVLAELPETQRVAVGRILSRAANGPATDEHVAGAAFLSVIERLATQTPVLVAIDDLQWLDSSSQTVVAFAVRRLSGRVGILVAVRSEAGSADVVPWLQLARPDGLERFRVSPLSLGGLHKLISGRLDRSLPRPTMMRIAAISGGNPFYALELARTAGRTSSSSESEFPGTLNTLVQNRVGCLDREVRTVLLAAASAARPTVELLADACGISVDRVVALLEEAENEGIVGIDGNQVSFSHPLLATGVYADAKGPQRREMHRRLAGVVEQPELRARHLALSATSADAEALTALDTAAEVLNTQGAPTVAGELVDLAIKLGGDTPLRRICAAGLHFRAGDLTRAREAIEPAIEQLSSGPLRATAINLLAAIRMSDKDFAEAAELVKPALDDAAGDPALLARTLLTLSMAQSMSGQFDDALSNSEQAVGYADESDDPALISSALAMWVMEKCAYGHGLDEANLRRALELEDPGSDVAVPFTASTVKALTLAWTGRLEEARTEMAAVGQRCIERGANSDMIWIADHTSWIAIWLGRYDEAARVAEDTMERAEQLGGRNMIVIARLLQVVVAAYTGREGDSRAAALQAIEDAHEVGSSYLAEWPIMSLGFLEVSLGNFDEALAILKPLLSRFDSTPGTEILTSAYIPDAVEAMVAVGRLDDAEPLIAALESNGSRLDRAWMLAIGARCRSMALAAEGDFVAAEHKAVEAMTEHRRLSMPFEQARTELLLGQLQRRQHHKDTAATTLANALHVFEELGTPLWAERARIELTRVDVGTRRTTVLTPSEQRVAALVASGMTSREVAAALFISPKTVEVNLTRIYRKLGIRSRAQLGSHLPDLQE